LLHSMARLLLLYLAAVLLHSAAVHSFQFYEGLVNAKVQSLTYLTSAVTKIVINVDVRNYGSRAADKYLVSLPQSLDSNMALIEVRDGDKKRLSIARTASVDLSAAPDIDGAAAASNSVFFVVDLPRALPADGGDSAQSLKVTVAYIHQLEPLPKKIKKSAKQFVVYEANKHFYSPYRTKRLGTKYSFASDKFKSYSKPAEVDGKKITYGPFSDVAPFSASESVRFHFQFHSAYLTMTEVVRDLEVSHWGNVRIEESFLLHHDGAALKGPYEVGMYDRYEHVLGQQGAASDPASVRSLKASLPSGASNVYYIDRIGNVSTSNFRPGRRSKKSVLEMRPRYPLYGGWKTDFRIGYDVASAELIGIDAVSRVHTLNVSFGIPFKEPVTDLLITRIALPEGAHDVEVHSPYDIEVEAESKRFTYLDTVIGGGRPLITFRKRNVINLHSEYFQITYVYDSTRIYFKPLLIISGIFAFFVAVMTLSRISPSLEAPASSASGDRVAVEQIMAMKGDGETAGRLDKMARKLQDHTLKAKVRETADEMRRVTARIKPSRKGRHKGGGHEVELRASISALLKGLQNNL